jgi:hypothetical protein
MFLSHKTVADRATRTNGFVTTCGYSSAALGWTNYATDNPTPVPIMLPQGVQGNITAISSWGYHSSSTQHMLGGALDANGDFYIWGNATQQSLGHFTTAANYVPHKAH